VLQARFAIVRGPARGWSRETLTYIMKACIIMHNMIVEDERNTDNASDIDYEQIDETPYVQISHEHTPHYKKTFILPLSSSHVYGHCTRG
jgi:hypothetical protein